MFLPGLVSQQGSFVFKFDAAYADLITAGFAGTNTCTTSNNQQTVNYTVANATGMDINNGVFIAGQKAMLTTPWGDGRPSFYALPGEKKVFEVIFEGPALTGSYPPVYNPGDPELNGGGPGYNYVRANFWLLESTLAYDVGFCFNVGMVANNSGGYNVAKYGVDLYGVTPNDLGFEVATAPIKVSVVINGGTPGSIALYINDHFNPVYTYTGIDTTIKRYLVVDDFIQRWLQPVENGKSYSGFAATSAANINNSFYYQAYATPVQLEDIYGKPVPYKPYWAVTTDRQGPGDTTNASVMRLDWSYPAGSPKALSASSISVSPNGQYVALGGRGSNPGYRIYPMSAFRPNSGSNIGNALYSESFFSAVADEMAFSADGQYFAAGLRGGLPGIVLSVRQVSDWSQVSFLQSGYDANAIAFSPDSTKLALHAEQDETRVAIYSIPGFNRTFLTNVLNTVNDLAFSPDGTMLAVCGTANTGLPRILIYETTGWTLLNSIPGSDFPDAPSSQANAVVFTPDGKRLVVGRTVTANGWDGLVEFDIIGNDPANWALHIYGGSHYVDTIKRLKISADGKFLYLRSNTVGSSSSGVVKYRPLNGNWSSLSGSWNYVDDIDFTNVAFPLV